MTSGADEAGKPRAGPEESGAATVVLGLLAPPQIPEEVVERLAAELPQALSERVSDRVPWEVPAIRDSHCPILRSQSSRLSLIHI